METNKIWQESPGGQYLLYTEDSKLISQIRGWNAYKDGRVREMGEYFNPNTSRPLAIQFRFGKPMLERVRRAAGA